MEVESLLHRMTAALLLALALLLAPAVLAEPAEDVTKNCAVTATENEKTRKNALNQTISKHWDAGEAGTLTVSLPAKRTAQGVMISHYGQATAVDVFDAEGERIGTGPGEYLVEWIPFDREVQSFTIARHHAGDALCISRLNVLTPGDLPKWVQRWQTLDGPAELLLIATHPDDEILWFGGMLPYYAGELHRRVMVVYMVGGLNPVRSLELLDGLWHMGVACYPDIGTFSNVGLDAVGPIYQQWGRDGAADRVTAVVRRYRPQVVVTQGIQGEYGHMAHIETVKAVIGAVAEGGAGDPVVFPDSAAQWGVWSPSKLYLHLWKENPIVFDWNQPLTAFDGKTGLQVAKAAYKMHVSQQNGVHPRSVKDSGQYDCSRFGLYWSAVGPDERHDDLFEHIDTDQ